MNGSSRKYWIILIVVALGLVVWVAPASAGVAASPDLSKPTSMSCEGLANLKLQNTTITLAASVPAGGFTPPPGPFGPPPSPVPVAFCRVVGVIKPTSDSNINFEVWMPAAGWNGRFNGVGNGGLAGSIMYDAMTPSLLSGYATASTDTGHQGFLGDGSWAMGHPEKLKDFGYRAIHLTAVDGQAITAAFYGKKASYSYFTGCSGGGQQAVQESQMFPEDYNGIVAGAPASFPTHMWPGELWTAWISYKKGTQLSLGGDPNGPPLPTPKLLTLNQAAVNACDAADGVVDGIIGDPRKCNFDPQVLKCPGADGPNCLTQAEVDTVKAIYAGLKDPTTKLQFWPGYEKGSEDQWGGHINPFSVPPSYFKFMVYNDPNWDYHTYDMTSPKNFLDLYKADFTLGPILDAMNPNLSRFAARGGKLLMWHGWSDQNISPRNSISYFQSVQFLMGERKTSDFLRLFMVPGMNHCGGGPGTDSFDALGTLVQWVEKNKAPEKIIASNLTSGISRPLCPYPQVAKYKGTGDTSKAENFVCVNPK